MIWHYYGKSVKPWDMPVQEILKEFHGLVVDRVRGRESHVPAVPISYNYTVEGGAEKNVDAMSEGEARALLKRLLSSGLASGGEGSGGQGSGGSTISNTVLTAVLTLGLELVLERSNSAVKL